MPAKYSIGDMVQSISDPSRIGTIVQTGEYHAGIQWYKVHFGGTILTKIAEVDLRPYVIAATPDENLLIGNFGGYKEFQRLITFHRLLRDKPLQNNINAFNASRTRFFPYQFKPLLKFLDSPKHRLLLADEVGLGKTIEAGLILTELRARQEVKRVLVVCPANLTSKWKQELEQRFAIDFSILNANGLITFLNNFEKSPDRAGLHGIISLESIRTNRVLDRLEALSPDFDLVIIDEAHHMRNFGTKTRKSGVVLAETANAMLLLTATPIHLGNQNLFSLLNILDDDEFPDIYTTDSRIRNNEPIVKAQKCMGQFPPELDEAIGLMREAASSQWISENPLLPEIINKLEGLKDQQGNQQQAKRLVVDVQRELSELNLLAHIFTRTKKKEAQTDTAVRKAFPIRVTLTDIEKEFYHAVTDYVRELSQLQSTSALIQSWILHMPQRRMASCIPAMVDYYRSRLPFEPDDCSEDDMVEEETEQGILPGIDMHSARQPLQKILAQWSLTGTDSKYDAFIKIIRDLKNEGPCKIIVFAFFKGTLRYLRDRLSRDGIQCRLIYGDIPIRERLKEIERFRNDQSEVLLSSRVGGEGLDLQFCDTLFNYDLPWNPMEVEQRIGRLDRIGQLSDTIRIFNFWIEGTIEQRILERLYERIKVFERSIGELEMILGEEVRNLERYLFSRKLTPEEELQRIEAATIVIVARMAQLEKLEGDSAKFIGADYFFQEEVDMIRKRRRYVTGYQIHRFLEDFLIQQCPRTILGYDLTTNLGELQPDQELRTFIQNANIAIELPHFFGSGTRKIPITFDSNVAFEKPKVEFLNVLHPLIQEITKFYASNKAQKIPSNAHFLILKTRRLPVGHYLYFIYKLKILAARERNLLESIFLNENLEPMAVAEDAEILLGEMVEKGEEPPVLNTGLGPEWGRQACNRARELLHERIQQVKAEVGRTNDAFIDRRLTSVKTFYQKTLDKKRSQLATGEFLERQERYLRMLRGTINRLETEAQTKEEALERLRTISIEYEDVAAGILEVR